MNRDVENDDDDDGDDDDADRCENNVWMKKPVI